MKVTAQDIILRPIVTEKSMEDVYKRQEKLRLSITAQMIL